MRLSPMSFHLVSFRLRQSRALQTDALPSAAAGSATKGTTLRGKSVAVKDNICTSAFPTTCSSAFLQGEHLGPPPPLGSNALISPYLLSDFKPNYDATVVSLIEQAGGHIPGKTNCDEFGMGSAIRPLGTRFRR